MTFVLAVLKKFLNESFKDISLFSYQCSLFCCCSATFISYHRTKRLSTAFLFFFFAAVQQLLYLTRSKALCQQLFKIIFCCPLRNISVSRVSLKIISCCDVFVNNFFIFFLLSFEAVIRFAVSSIILAPEYYFVNILFTLFYHFLHIRFYLVFHLVNVCIYI